MDSLTISQVCRATGISRAQLRVWRKEGLISEPVDYERGGRGAGNEAHYPPIVLGEVERVKRGLATRRSLAELKALFGCTTPVTPPVLVDQAGLLACTMMVESEGQVDRETIEFLLAAGVITDLARVETDPENPDAIVIRWRYPQAPSEFARRVEVFFGPGKPRMEALGRFFAEQRRHQLVQEMNALEQSQRGQPSPLQRKYYKAEGARIQRELQALTRHLKPTKPDGADSRG